MTEPKVKRLPQCDRCLNNARNPHILCAIHPLGVNVETEICPDFKVDPDLEPLECWEPDGASYYGEALVITPTQRWTREQQLDLLDWHPMFTGRCPNCEMPLGQMDLPRIHWDCDYCDWKDDSV